MNARITILDESEPDESPSMRSIGLSLRLGSQSPVVPPSYGLFVGVEVSIFPPFVHSAKKQGPNGLLRTGTA